MVLYASNCVHSFKVPLGSYELYQRGKKKTLNNFCRIVAGFLYSPRQDTDGYDLSTEYWFNPKVIFLVGAIASMEVRIYVRLHCMLDTIFLRSVKDKNINPSRRVEKELLNRRQG